LGRIADHVIDEVRSRADIVQLVSRYVSLRRSGRRHWGLCPFHAEDTASFQVHEERQIFYCFGCNAGGDVFGFRMRHDGLDFPDAVRAIAREVGVAIPDAEADAGGRHEVLHRAQAAARDFFREVMRSREGAAARQYLDKRGVPEELIDRFGVGFAPPRWDGLLSALGRSGFTAAALEQAGLVAPRQDGDGHYDRFRGRLIFPIAEASGNVVGFGGRTLDDSTPKYLNSPESPIYHKGRVLFGLPQALDAIRRTGRAVVVEGYFDVLALHRAGIQEVVAPCGTALTEEHARRLRRYAGEVVLLFDADDAGRRAAERSLGLLLAEGLRVRGSLLPEGQDPDSLVARDGPEALAACVESAGPLLDRLIDEALKSSHRHAWAAADAAQALGPYLRAIANPIERADYLRRVAQRLNVSVSALEAALGPRGGDASPGAPRPGPAAAPRAADPVSRTLLEALLGHPDLVPLIEPLRLEWLPEGETRELLRHVVESTRARGRQALAHLCSSDEVLPVGLRSALVEVASRAEDVERVAAERAVRDCMARLSGNALQQEYRDLVTRIERSDDPSEQKSLLEAMQSNLARRRTLASQFNPV
jgi:DNA primase